MQELDSRIEHIRFKMKINEDFKISASKGWSHFKTLCIILLFSALIYEYLTIASDEEIRVVSFQSPFGSAKFYQDLK